jgi:hypothetical protein
MSQSQRYYRQRVSTVALLMLTVTAGSGALAGAYFSEVADGTTLRCSSVPSSSLPEDVLERYRIAADSRTGVLSCVIQRQGQDGSLENLSGRINARVVTLTGVTEAPVFREVLENEAVSYLATYAIPLDGPLSFQVAAQPAGSEMTITVEHDDIRPQQ